MPSAGMVSLRSRSPGAVDLGLQGRFIPDAAGIAAGGGALHVEPFLTPRISLPVSLTAMSPLYTGGRIGPRFRTGERLALGFGFTFAPAFARIDYCSGGRPCPTSPQVVWASALDLEVAVGRRWRWFELAWSTRFLCLWGGDYGEAASPEPIGGFSVEVSFAFYVHRTVALVLGLQAHLLAPYVADPAGPEYSFTTTINLGVLWQARR